MDTPTTHLVNEKRIVASEHAIRKDCTVIPAEYSRAGRAASQWVFGQTKSRPKEKHIVMMKLFKLLSPGWKCDFELLNMLGRGTYGQVFKA